MDRPRHNPNKIRRGVAIAVAVLSGLALASCRDGGDDRPPQDAESTESTVAAEGLEVGAITDTDPSFHITENWSEVLPGKDVEVDTFGMTEERCLAEYPRTDGGRFGEYVQEDPRVLVVNGSCSEQLGSPEVGIYNEPYQARAGAPIVGVDGQPLGVECQTGGQPIHNVIEESPIWLGVVALNEAGNEQAGYIPLVNVAVPDVRNVPNC